MSRECAGSRTAQKVLLPGRIEPFLPGSANGAAETTPPGAVSLSSLRQSPAPDRRTLRCAATSPRRTPTGLHPRPGCPLLPSAPDPPSSAPPPGNPFPVSTCEPDPRRAGPRPTPVSNGADASGGATRRTPCRTDPAARPLFQDFKLKLHHLPPNHEAQVVLPEAPEAWRCVHQQFEAEIPPQSK